MNVLIIGAGVIGSYLAHDLINQGHNVTIFARGDWKTVLAARGLTIRHQLQRRTSVDRPRIVDSIQSSDIYDAVFSVMQYGQQQTVLKLLAEANSPLIVLIGNNLSIAEMEKEILSQSPTKKTVLFGFLPIGGRREDGKVVCVRLRRTDLPIGACREPVPENVRAIIESLFAAGNIKPEWTADIDAWLKCHLAIVLPIAFHSYQTGCDLRRSTGKQRKAVLKAVGEGFEFLKSAGYSIVPAIFERIFQSSIKRIFAAILLFFVTKTVVGELVVSAHCRSAADEIADLDAGFQKIREENPVRNMSAWDELRNALPDWDEVKKRIARD